MSGSLDHDEAAYPAPAPRFPPEITDHIICSCSDRSSLLKFALVCRSWVPASRTAVFKRRVMIMINPDRASHIGIVLSNPYFTLSIYLSEIHILLSPHSTLSIYLVDIHIHFSRRLDDSSAAAALRAFLDARIAFVSFVINGNTLRVLPDEIYEIVTSSSRTLRALSVLEFSVTDLSPLIDCVSHCSLLDKLVLISGFHGNTTLPPLSLGLPPPLLNDISLDLSTDMLQIVIPWLSNSTSPVGPTKLALSARHDAYPVWKDYLRTIAPRLTHLSLIDAELMDSHSLSGPGLSSLTHFQLRRSHTLGQHRSLPAQTLLTLAEFIRTLYPHTAISGLTSIRIEDICAPRGDEETRAYAEVLDRCLAERMADNAEVHLFLHYLSEPRSERWEEEVRVCKMAFPRCSVQSRFRFMIEDSRFSFIMEDVFKVW